MNRNQKIALGCGGAGCLGLIVVVIAGCVFYFLYYNQNRRYSASNYNFNINSNSNSNSNDNSDFNSNSLHEANQLHLDINKAVQLLNWSPYWNVSKSVEKTINWYKKKKSPFLTCKEDIKEFIEN